MDFLRKISSEWALRIGFGVMYLHSGFDLLFHPTAWHWALPFWLRNAVSLVVPLNAYLRFQGAIELLMALGLLAWFLKNNIVKWVALLSTIEMAVILFLTFVPFSAYNFSITFRDIGLLGGALALFVLILKKQEVTATTPNA